MGTPSPPSPLVPPPRPWALESQRPARMNPIPLIVVGGRVLGLILLFVGTLIGVLGASTPGSCFDTPASCSGSFALAANLIIAAKVFWALGLFCLAGASGLRLQNGILPGGDGPWTEGPNPSPSAPHVWANLSLLLLSIVLMAVLLLTINAWPAIPFGG